jgi:hypothetical protein
MRSMYPTISTMLYATEFKGNRRSAIQGMRDLHSIPSDRMTHANHFDFRSFAPYSLFYHSYNISATVYPAVHGS